MAKWFWRIALKCENPTESFDQKSSLELLALPLF
jgi:hypothetical protein